jgi:hypothetical protein
MSTLRRGDEVAILPSRGSPSEKVRELAVVAHVGPALIELENGGLFFATDGCGMNVYGCIVPATEEHRAVLDRRSRQTARPVSGIL